MRTDKKLKRAACASAAAVAITGVAMLPLQAASGDPVSVRVTDPAGQVTPAATPPVQQVTGLDCTTTPCELWAKEGTTTITIDGLPTAVPIWGFATSALGDPVLPGPTITANTGDTVTITVHNELPAAAGDFALEVPHVPVDERLVASVPTATAGSTTMSFVADEAGTMVYEAGATQFGGPRMVAMGLAGVLVVRPPVTACPDPLTGVLGCLYGDPLAGGRGSELGFDAGTDVFHDEALVALNSIDTRLADDPFGFDMATYAPSIHLINGKAFPDTDVIDTQAGHTLAVRYANLGLAAQSMGLVGTHQRLVGRDASPLPHGEFDVVAQVNPGQTIDASVSVPTEAFAGQRYALYEQGRRIDTASAGVGGALTFLNVWGQQYVPGAPVAKLDALAADVTTGAADLSFSGSSGPAVAARYWIDDIEVPLLSGSPNDVTVNGDGTISGAVPTAELAMRSNGVHVIWVQLSSDGTTFGPAAGVAFTIDRAGPVVRPVELDPAFVNGAVDVGIRATADTTVTGTSDVTAGNAVLGTCPALGDQPTGLSLAANMVAPTIELTGILSAADVGALTEGVHEVNVAAVDALGHWSNDGASVPAAQCGTASLTVDLTSPTTGAASADPAVTDGVQSYVGATGFLDVVRVTATITDAESNGAISPIAEVEGFLADGTMALPGDAVNGAGVVFIPSDGKFDSAVETAYADIPLTVIRALTPGAHGVWIHGRDAAGNWGVLDAAPTVTITYSGAAPQVSAYAFDPLTGDLDVTATATGNGVTVATLEYQIGIAPDLGGAWTGVPAPTTASTVAFALTLVAGAEDNVWVRIVDSQGVTGPVVGRPTADALSFNAAGSRVLGTINATAPGGVTAAEWSIGAVPAAAGTGTAFGGAAIVGASPKSFNANLGAVQPVGTVVWVRAMDAQGNWGPATSVVRT